MDHTRNWVRYRVLMDSPAASTRTTTLAQLDDAATGDALVAVPVGDFWREQILSELQSLRFCGVQLVGFWMVACCATARLSRTLARRFTPKRLSP